MVIVQSLLLGRAAYSVLIGHASRFLPPVPLSSQGYHSSCKPQEDSVPADGTPESSASSQLLSLASKGTCLLGNQRSELINKWLEVLPNRNVCSMWTMTPLLQAKAALSYICSVESPHSLHCSIWCASSSGTSEHSHDSSGRVLNTKVNTTGCAKLQQATRAETKKKIKEWVRKISIK